MRILIRTYVFFPSVGGIETILDTMAREFITMGHEVRLSTPCQLGPDSPPDYDRRFPYPVYRERSLGVLREHLLWCDVFYQNHGVVRDCLALLLVRRPWVCEYMIWRFGDPGTRLTLKDRISALILKHMAYHMGQSHALVRYLPFPSVYVPTPFRSGLLRVIPGVARDRDVVFAGRLVKSKGVDNLLQAMAGLKARGRRYTCTIIGPGADLEHFKTRAAELGLTDDGTVTFTGAMFGEDFARMLNRHKIMCIPSVWDEPFGTVAAEGIACGCVAVAADSGGLRDTVGPCGVVYPRHDVHALTDVLDDLLQHPDRFSQYTSLADSHLAQFRADVSAQARLKVFNRALKREAV